jgi:hypothetical protein
MATDLHVIPSEKLRSTYPMGLRKRYLEHEKKPSAVMDLALPISMDAMLTEPNRGPDIDWNPSFSKYQARVRVLSKIPTPRPTCVPESFPKAVSAPWVWEGNNISEPNYMVILGAVDIDEAEEALAYFKGIHNTSQQHHLYQLTVIRCSTRL